MDLNWKDITIEKWIKLNSINSDNELTTLIARIAVLTGKDEAELRALPYKEFDELVTTFQFLKDEPKKDYKLTFEIEGIEYGLIPDFSQISTGEWIDIEEFKKDSIKNCHLILATIYRPITKRIGNKWEIEPHDSKGFMERANLFKKTLSVEDVLGAVVFFSHIAIQYIQIMEPYLKNEMKLMKKKTKVTRTRMPKVKNKNS
jgi:hypothetical protein